MYQERSDEMRSFSIYTLGCKVNLYESEFIANDLVKYGYIKKEFDEVCDIYIINTCSVTNTSDVKSRKIIRNAIHKNPDACVVAVGCFVEANKDYTEDGLDIVIGTKDKSKIATKLDEYFGTETFVNTFSKLDDDFEDMFIDNFDLRTRAFVKVQDGCENFCSFCIIPSVRGKCRSKKLEKVILEIEALVKNGFKEVVLTGIHTGNYGVDLGIKFSDLLESICKIDGLLRLRISSIEISEIDEEVLSIIKGNNIIVDHIHIPLQSGSDTILKLMNRKYNTEYFLDKINTIRSIRPNMSITSDVIVGFPNETEELFMETYNFIKEVGFTKLHVFPYSERAGTVAASMDGSVLVSERKERAKRLLLLSKELELNYYNKFIGKTVSVLIETVKNGSIGHTGEFLSVKVDDKLEVNTIVDVVIKKVDYPYLIGEVL